MYSKDPKFGQSAKKTWNHHHPVICLTTGSKPLPKRSLYTLRSRASSFKWEYPLLSLRSSSSLLRFLPCLLVTSISPFIFPSIACFRRQFLRKMWPIQLAFRILIACRILLCSLTWSNMRNVIKIQNTQYNLLKVFRKQYSKRYVEFITHSW